MSAIQLKKTNEQKNKTYREKGNYSTKHYLKVIKIIKPVNKNIFKIVIALFIYIQEDRSLL